MTQQSDAEELVLLGILADRVAQEQKSRRERIATEWAGGTTIAVELPNPENPARPVAIGKVRADGGQGVARVADRDAWVAWCREHQPHNVVHQTAGHEFTARTSAMRELAERIVETVRHPFRGFGAPDEVTQLFDTLETLGLTLAPARAVPEVTEVRHSWETATLKAAQEAGRPVDPNGEVPDGIEFVPNSTPVKPVVTIGKSDETRQAFVDARRHLLPAIAGGITYAQEGTS